MMSMINEITGEVPAIPDSNEEVGGEEGRERNLSVDVQKMTSFSLRRKPSDKGMIKSRTPPSSPKLRLSSEMAVGGSKLGRKGSGIRVGGAGNPKGRKQYSTLNEDSNGDGDDDEDDTENFLLSKGHLAREKRSSTIKTVLVTPVPPTVAPPPSSIVNPQLGNIDGNFPVHFTPPNEARFPLFDASGIEGDMFDFNPIVDSNVISIDTSSLPPPVNSNDIIMPPSIGFNVDQSLTVPQSSLTTAFTPSPPVIRQGIIETDWSVSDELYKKCQQQFASLCPNGEAEGGGFLSGDKARDFFMKSNLPVSELSRIWKLSDINKDGQLNFDEFIIAMKLVLMRRKGHDIPSALPEALRTSILSRTAPSTDPDSTLKFKAPPPRPPLPPPSLTNKTEPTTASSGATPATTLIEHVVIGDKPYAKVNVANKTNRKREELDSSSDVLVDPAVSRLVTVDTAEDTTGDEDETSTLVTVAGGVSLSGDGPVPKPRKKKRSPQKLPANKAPPSDFNKPKNRPAPPRPPAPYRSPPHVASPNVIEDILSSPCTDDIAPIVPITTGTKRDNLVNTDDRSGKGHGRSTSWDLTKMLREESMGVHEDLPSAEPPKLPPRRVILSPSSDDESGTNKTFTPLLQRSASTGSIASVGVPTNTLKQSSRSPSIDSGPVLDPSAGLLPKTKSEPSHKRVAPGPPTKAKPIVPKKPLYPPSYKKVSHEDSESDERGPLSMDTYKKKTKMELQRSVRQLKEENAVYLRMNTELKEKLTQLTEQRIKLEVKLESLKKT